MRKPGRIRNAVREFCGEKTGGEYLPQNILFE